MRSPWELGCTGDGDEINDGDVNSADTLRALGYLDSRKGPRTSCILLAISKLCLRGWWTIVAVHSYD